jgi:hypothetical protein
MLLSKQIIALNYIQINSHLVDPDYLMPIISSSMAPKIASADLDSSCDSDNNQKTFHASDDDTLQEEPITTIVEEFDVPPPVPKQKHYQHNYHEKRRRKKKMDCSIM